MSYQKLFQEGKLAKLRDELRQNLESCTLCPRECRVNRLKGETGFCRAESLARVSSVYLHYGEEPELVGKGGSGTIFFSFCNLGCLYCQNYTLSHGAEGEDMSAQELCDAMLELQAEGAENINFVTPSHYTVQIVEALVLAVEKGLKLPLVYNCGGYESVEILKKLDGVFDIYMPDLKYSDSQVSEKFSRAPDYWEIAQAAVLEMRRQVGDLVIEEAAARKGLLIRHLVLPNRLAGSFKILDFIRGKLSADTYVNIMQQYFPCYKACSFPELSRRITHQEFQEVIEYARKIGLHRGF